MIDLGYTSYAFIDTKTAHLYNILIRPLPTLRTLETFEGSLVNNVTDVAKAMININDHAKHITFYLTTLSHYPIILGML